MAKPKIPDRSDEPALQDSLDHGPQSMTAANSDDVEHNPAPEARDDEGNSIEPPPPPDPAAVDDPAVGIQPQAGRERLAEDLPEKPDADDMEKSPDQQQEDQDSEVATDEKGNEMLWANDVPATGGTRGDETLATSNVSSDRVPATDAEPEGSLDHVKTAPLGIEEIDNLEEDSKGG